MSIQSNINQVLGSAATLKKLGEIGKRDPKEVEAEEKLIDAAMAEDEAKVAAENKTKEMVDRYKEANPDATEEEIAEYTEMVIEENAPISFYTEDMSKAKEQIKRNMYREKVRTGSPYTTAQVQKAQMAMYENLANMKMGEIEAKKAIARESIPKVQTFPANYDISREVIK